LKRGYYWHPVIGLPSTINKLNKVVHCIHVQSFPVR